MCMQVPQLQQAASMHTVPAHQPWSKKKSMMNTIYIVHFNTTHARPLATHIEIVMHAQFSARAFANRSTEQVLYS